MIRFVGIGMTGGRAVIKPVVVFQNDPTALIIHQRSYEANVHGCQRHLILRDISLRNIDVIVNIVVALYLIGACKCFITEYKLFYAIDVQRPSHYCLSYCIGVTRN